MLACTCICRCQNKLDAAFREAQSDGRLGAGAGRGGPLIGNMSIADDLSQPEARVGASCDGTFVSDEGGRMVYICVCVYVYMRI